MYLWLAVAVIPRSLSYCYFDDPSSKYIFLSNRNDVFVPLKLLIFLISSVSPLQGKKLIFFHSLQLLYIPLSPHIFPLLPPPPPFHPPVSSPPSCRSKNINTGTSNSCSSVYIFTSTWERSQLFSVRLSLFTLPPLSLLPTPLLPISFVPLSFSFHLLPSPPLPSLLLHSRPSSPPLK